MDTFELLDDIETDWGSPPAPSTGPSARAKSSGGVYDRETRQVEIFSDTHKELPREK